MKYDETLINCPIRWKCLSLNDIITVSENAIYDPSKGWLCDCGKRVKNHDVIHKILNWGLRHAKK